jgi:hypothetical protein
MTRLLLTLLLVGIALAPLGLHLTVLAPKLIGAGYRGVAAVSFIGSMAWVSVFVRMVATPRSAS